MHASLVFDGTVVRIPESMGTPTGNQMRGTELERLCECASRICYDSLGLDDRGRPRGRSSEQLHKHILEVQNHSVLEHAAITVRFDRDIFSACHNRKGVWVEGGWEVTANLRAILEWRRHTQGANEGAYTSAVGDTLRYYAHRLAPQVVAHSELHELLDAELKQENLTADQACVTLYLYGSRGFTHEQVRHRFSMSQRSTRYVDESESPYIEHPLVTDFLTNAPTDLVVAVRNQIDASIAGDRATYDLLVTLLSQYCSEKGMERTAARKQARGAARGYLGNALASEMLFTAPLSGWRWILRQRKNALADAEIRQIYSPALAALQASRWGDHFKDFVLVPSPDGIGTVLQ